MAKQIELSIPTSYEDITLRKWLELQKELRNYEDDEEASTAIILYHLCGLDPIMIKNLSMDSYNMLKTEIAAFLGNTDFPLQRFIDVKGVEWGFEPNLSNMSYGAYADITKFGNITIDDNWAKVMGILYRPVTKKQFDKYSIQPYTGEIDEQMWLDVPMSIHFGALFFLFNLLTDLLSATLKSSMEEVLHPNIKPILERNGGTMLQLLNWQMVISPALMLSFRNP